MRKRQAIAQGIGCMIVFLNIFPILQQLTNQVHAALSQTFGRALAQFIRSWPKEIIFFQLH